MTWYPIQLIHIQTKLNWKLEYKFHQTIYKYNEYEMTKSECETTALPTDAPAAIRTDSYKTSTMAALMSGPDWVCVSKWPINAWITTYAYCCWNTPPHKIWFSSLILTLTMDTFFAFVTKKIARQCRLLKNLSLPQQILEKYYYQVI